MIIETFGKISPTAQVDRGNSRLNGIVIMSTDFNLNNNATFSIENQKEIVSLGNTNKVYCYLGHAKKGFTSSDRLAYRLGYFENFSVDGSKVRADLQLSPTIEPNPIIPQGIKEYIYTLAEKESNECGFSMSVGMCYNEDDTVSILELFSVDLVEVPALTVAMFAKEENKDMSEDTVNEKLTPVLDALKLLSSAIDAGSDTKPSADAVKAAIDSLFAPVEAATVEPVVEPTVEVEPIVEPTIEVEPISEPVEDPSIEAKEVTEIETVKAEILSLKELISNLQSALLAQANYAKEEPKVEEPKTVVFSVSPRVSPVVGGIVESKEAHKIEYHRLRAIDPVEAARYHSLYLK